jgi:hypothetical protein
MPVFARVIQARRRTHVYGFAYHCGGSSATNVWFAGTGPSHDFMRQWNGTAIVDHDYTADSGGGFNIYSAASTLTLFHTGTVMLHWDGSTWLTPWTDPNGTSGYGFGRSTSDVYVALGGVSGADGHLNYRYWDGSAWSSVLTATSSFSNSGLYHHHGRFGAVTPNGTNYVGVVMQTFFSLPAHNIIGHINCAALDELYNLGAYEPISFWAASNTDVFCLALQAFTSPQLWTLVQGDLTGFTPLTLPTAPTGFDYLWTAVTGISTSDYWVVGYANDNTTFHTSGLAAHWNGSAWTVYTPANANGGRALYFMGAYAAASNDVWVSAQELDATGNTFPSAWHWNGTAWNFFAALLD